MPDLLKPNAEELAELAAAAGLATASTADELEADPEAAAQPPPPSYVPV